MDISGLGESVVEQLVEKKLIQTPSDIYKLKLDDLVNLERFGIKSAENLLNGVQASKKIPFGRVLYALGILLLKATQRKQFLWCYYRKY